MEKIRISNKEIIGSVMGQIYRLHPYHTPENIDIINKALNDKLESLPDYHGRVDVDWKVFEFDSFSDFEKKLKTFLMTIKEFRQLNISKARKDAGQTEMDEGFKFVTMYDSNNKDVRYTDFIDIDALIRNIAREIDVLQIHDADCFLCKFAKEYGSMNPSNCHECEVCICNPKLRYSRETHPMALKPRNQFTKEEKEKYDIC